MMRLYSFAPSPNPLKARLALAELGVPHEVTEVNLLKGEQRTDEFKAVNPMSQVPVLVDGALTLRESNAIVAYLGREYGMSKKLWPSEPRKESEALQWLFFESSQLAPRAGSFWWSDVVAPKVGRDPMPAAVLEFHREAIARPLDQLDAHLERHLYVLGHDFSLVDCSIGAALSMLKGTRLDEPKRWPNLASYREKIWKRESWKSADGAAIHRF